MYHGRMQGEPGRTQDTRLTYDDFLLFPDDGQRHEIIDGEHYVTPSPIPVTRRCWAASTSRSNSTFDSIPA